MTDASAAAAAAAGAPTFGGFGSAFTPGGFGAGSGGTVAVADNVGYIDSAIIRSRFRMRYDTAWGLNSPDRASFFYAKCGCFNVPGALGIPGYKSIYDPRANGPLRLPPAGTGHPALAYYGGETRVNYQEATPYLEYAANRTTSMFIEMPARFVNFQLPITNVGSNVQHFNTYGWSDMNLGFKHAFVAEPDRFYTFQFRTYVPTGSGSKGLGTDHATLEPGLLIFQRLSDRLYFSGQFRDWIPVNATDFAGNTLIYGAGLTYNIVLTQNFRVAPVAEFVGWTVLGGKQLEPNKQFNPANPVNFINNSPSNIVSATGDTIVNGKFGLRFGLGSYNQAGGGSALNDRHSLYVGYGHALTGDHWYRDILRVEYNFWF
jgi:hypothetical protein